MNRPFIEPSRNSRADYLENTGSKGNTPREKSQLHSTYPTHPTPIDVPQGFGGDDLASGTSGESEQRFPVSMDAGLLSLEAVSEQLLPIRPTDVHKLVMACTGSMIYSAPDQLITALSITRYTPCLPAREHKSGMV